MKNLTTAITTNKSEFRKSISFTNGAEHTCCSLCDGGYDKRTYYFVQITKGPLDGAVVCPECLKAYDEGKDVFFKRLEERANQLEAISNNYKSSANMLRKSMCYEWNIQTHAEWTAKQEQSDKEYYTGNNRTEELMCIRISISCSINQSYKHTCSSPLCSI